MNSSFYCSTPIWNTSSSWETMSPDLTSCFQYFITPVCMLVYCVLMFAPTMVHLKRIAQSEVRYNTATRVQRTAVTVMRALCSLTLSLLLIIDLIVTLIANDTMMPIEFKLHPVLIFVAIVFVSIIQFLEMRKRRATSGACFLFWLLLLIHFALMLQSELRSKALQEALPHKFVLLIAYTCFSTLALIAATVSMQSAAAAAAAAAAPPCPERTANYLSRISFWWMTSLIVKGYRHSLTAPMLFELNRSDCCAFLGRKFRLVWAFYCDADCDHGDYYCRVDASGEVDNRQNGIELKANANGDANDHANGAKADAKSDQADALLPRSVIDADDNKKLNPILIKTLAKIFAPNLLLSMSLKFFYDILNFSSTQVLKAVLAFLESDTDYAWRGIVFVVLILCIGLLQTAILQQYFHTVFNIGMRMRTVVMSAIYNKSLRLSVSARKASTTGSIVTLMSVDAFKFQEIMSYLNMIWSGPLQIAICIALLYRELGFAALAGVAVLIVLVPFNAALSRRLKKLQSKHMQHKDTRMKLINEVLSGIRVIKLYAWEPAFAAQIAAVRCKEIAVMRRLAVLYAANAFAWTCAPVMVSLVAFSVYTLSSPDHVLDAQKCFVSIALFNLLKFPLTMIPFVITSCLECYVSVKRLTRFLLLEEIPKDAVAKQPHGLPVAVSFDNCSFSWSASQSEPTLTNINFSCKRGSLVAIVGSVGSGKSSLLSCILGDIPRLSGTVSASGSIAYAGQEPFIQHLTLRENILFNSAMDPMRYQQVIQSCALQPDLDLLPAGDLTEIGEKGITLSGGQKARVSLARACYANRDIYLLDDPLSAVDVHVGKQIFEQVLSSVTGCLRDKTRLLVTHSLTYLPNADEIVVLDGGTVVERGTFAELVQSGGSFSELIGQFAATGEVKGQELSIDNKSAAAEPIDSKKPAAYKTVDDEKSQIGRVKCSVYLTYFRAVGYLFCLAVIGAAVVSHGLSLAGNFWLADWTKDSERFNDSVMAAAAAAAGDDDDGDESVGPKWSKAGRIAVYGAIGAVQAISIICGTLLCTIACLQASGSLHNDLLNRILSCTVTFFESTPLGRIVNRFGADVDTVDKNLSEKWRSLLRIMFWVLEAIIAISYSFPLFLLVLACVAVLFYAIQRLFIPASRQLKRLESSAKSPIFSHFSETLNGASSIRAFEQQSKFEEICNDRIDAFNKCYFPSVSSNRWLAVRLELLGVTIITVTMLFGVLSRDSTAAGMVGLAAVYALNITQSLNWLIRMSSDLENNIVSVERIKEYSKLQQEAAWQLDNEPNVGSDWPMGDVKFEHYSCKYRPDSSPAISDISIDISAGQRVGIVGRTGSGKSTLTLALFRVLEASSGKISIDGVDISQLGLHTIRERITLIPQDPILFAGSLRWNLDPFQRHTDDALWSALDAAHLSSWARSLSDAGLQRTISEGGSNLSLGQRQLLCLARALLRRSSLLVMDEATAAVDLQTDLLIQRTVRMSFAHATLITVAHRISTVMDYDRIIVMQRGRVVEMDNPKALLADSASLFYSMARQAGLV